MTMLDQMRRHKGWLKWSLVLVVLAFIVFYIPDFMATNTGAAPGAVLAEVQGEPITVGAFQRRYNAQIQAYRNAYGGQVSEQLLRQLGIQQQILQQLVDEEAMVAEARRQGLTVGDPEVRARILAMPAFQENGRFIGEQRYRQILQFQNPPMTTTEFEANLRRAILVEKLRNVVTAWMSLTDEEVAEEFRLRHEQVKLDVVPVSAEAFRDQVRVTDADITAYFEDHIERYRVGEKRRIKYALVDVDRVRERVAVPEAEIQVLYEQNRMQYTTPAQVRASHILFAFGDEDEAATRARAEAVLEEVRAGGDFADLARKHSDDQSNAAEGGDLDYFGRGRMVPEFEAAAFALPPGETSDLVRTDFGYHIIRVTDVRPETTRSLEEVRPEIEDQLKWQQAQAQAEEEARALEAAVKSAGDLEAAARDRNVPVQETGFFLRDEPIDGLGPAPEVSAQVFQLEAGEVTPALRVARGWVVATVSDRQDSYLPPLAEVRDQVREDLIETRAAALAAEQAGEIAARLQGARDFAAEARRAGLTVTTTELIPRRSPIAEMGVSPEIDEVAFSLEVGGVSGPIATPQGTVIVRLVERKDVTDEQLAEGRDALRAELLEQRRDRFFSAYMHKAKQDLRIQIHQQALARVMQ